MTKAIKFASKFAKKSVYLTPTGLAEAKAELEFLKKNKRAEIAERIHQAREYGDLTENSEYDSAMEDQSLIENRISQLENILKSVKIIDSEHDNEFVVIGSTVKVEMDEEIDEFTIVGRVEADPAKKRISNESPLGSALLGAKKGEEVEVATPIVRYKCKVLEIT
ncbi:transcription elongation factor GreA [Candidatus Daviesbacteria bacterium RIFCSPHIGHO2_02_FULL_36_13]|uniref:Transcription elongation factor GreA n=1 Tax=Candidatus Daviesbacteria bacterium RIFCSPHIGHO2_02_FULL_36_13 TaxID=1797768 RepID=A0A1F5JZ31_9BACT|nr:MAG: transcription elongation factor GreA [Candidatus Daviesbacteria bacterium RIFCSPHIGHO2_02_FULL_36_13]